MKMPALDLAYEAARTWPVHPIAHPSPAWAHIVRRGMATWMRETPPERQSPKPFSQLAHLDVSPLLTIVAAMVAEVCQ